jgi:1,4-alpha-glucan branching enzyme
LIAVISWNEDAFYDRSYRIGFPSGGHWQEVFNSDVYEKFSNPSAQGNFGGVEADGPSWNGLPCSAGVTLPANSILVFARDFGDF